MHQRATSAIRLPAEWEPQDAVLLAWPHADSDWQPVLEEISAVYLELVRIISCYQQLVIISPQPEEVQLQLIKHGITTPGIRIERVSTNDTWIRDFGPLTVLHNERPRLLDFGFNGWGNKFPAARDNRATAQLHAAGVFGTTPLDTVDLILEGGSIESDGKGTLLTTTKCLLNPNRNPHLDKQQLEKILQQKLGAKQILWLKHGYLAGDDTDAHIDTLARLCPHETICYVRCTVQKDEHYQELQRMEEELKALKTAAGEPFNLVPLPWPKACYDDQGERLPATYANYLVINRAVLVPTYKDPADQAALTAVSGAYPDRDIIGVDCRAVIRQHGSLHCISMQLPRGVLHE